LARPAKRSIAAFPGLPTICFGGPKRLKCNAHGKHPHTETVWATILKLFYTVRVDPSSCFTIIDAVRDQRLFGSASTWGAWPAKLA
jgi:hypothetical protein